MEQMNQKSVNKETKGNFLSRRPNVLLKYSDNLILGTAIAQLAWTGGAWPRNQSLISIAWKIIVSWSSNSEYIAAIVDTKAFTGSIE